MPKVLGLDISTNAGWAVVTLAGDGGPPVLGNFGLIQKEKTAIEYGPYPLGYRIAAKTLAKALIALVVQHRPDVVIVEETNQGKNRYTQKLLEWIHLYFQQAWDDGTLAQSDVFWDESMIVGQVIARPPVPEPKYISTGIWRHALGLKKPKDAKARDRLLKKAEALAEKVAPRGTPEYRKALNAEKKRLGVKGKWNKKMLAVNHVNDLFGLDLKLKDNDSAEAICLVLAYAANAPLCDGNPNQRGND